MKGMPVYLLLLCSTLSWICSRKQPLSVKQLTDSASSVTKNYSDPAGFNDAVEMLNQAILIDSNNQDVYNKKYFLEFSQGQFAAAEKTLAKLIQFKPDSAELYASDGFLKEFRQDSIDSKKSFARAIVLYKLTMDTMNRKNPFWLYDWKMTAICMIMVGQEKVIHDFLKEHCRNALDSSFYDVKNLSMSKVELLQAIRAKYNR